jgi:diguanylate cyclase (GGDEF)-like protein/PAS domain S-box-containing protein
MGTPGGTTDASMPTDPAEPSSVTLFRALTEESSDFVVVITDDGSVAYMNPASETLTGWTGADLGRSVFDLLHPDDLRRAALDLAVHSQPGTPPGSSTYRLRRADGSWARLQGSTAQVTDGSNRLIAVYSRPAEIATEEVLYALLRTASPADALNPVCDMFNWKAFGSRVGIGWSDHDGLHSVATGLPAELAGGDDAPQTPWAACRRSGKPQRGTDLTGLDDARRGLAERLGLAAYWIEPVVTSESEVCGVITVWTRQGGPGPEYHSSGMEMAKNFVELILRWIRQVRQLDHAAHRDPLTGLANRRSFLDSLGAESGGAVLYCDLDRFKPVNDELGHTAGDALLRAVADRIQTCVRAGDVVARLGGDEFAVPCRGATRDQAAELAERIRAAVTEPFVLLGCPTRVSISIGVAHAADRLADDVMESADHALYRAKADGGSTVRWPSADGP